MSAPRSYSPVPIPSGLRPSPLDKGSRPLDPRFTGTPTRRTGLLLQRRGWLSRLTLPRLSLPLTGRERKLGTPLFESAFVAVGLKLCGLEMPGGPVCRPYGICRSCGGRPHGAAPTAEIRPGALARQSQAYSLNRTSSNFYKPRAQWPGGNLERHSDFARRKFCLDLQVCVPRNGGPGVRRIWTRSVHPEPSPGDSLVTFSSLRKSLAAAAAKFPGATNPRDAARRVVAQASFSCPYGAIHLLAPYEKRNHCLLPAGGGTPCA